MRDIQTDLMQLTGQTVGVAQGPYTDTVRGARLIGTSARFNLNMVLNSGSADSAQVSIMGTFNDLITNPNGDKVSSHTRVLYNFPHLLAGGNATVVIENCPVYIDAVLSLFGTNENMDIHVTCTRF